MDCYSNGLGVLTLHAWLQSWLVLCACTRAVAASCKTPKLCLPVAQTLSCALGTQRVALVLLMLRTPPSGSHKAGRVIQLPAQFFC